VTQTITVDQVVVRFAGDSGDGIQLLGSRFAQQTALAGNDFATLPSYPAEIRAPRGSVGGVSSFQIQFGDQSVYTPGDRVDALVALNPAALKANLADVVRGGLIIVDSADFASRRIDKAGFSSDPLTDGSLDAYHVVAFDLTAQTAKAVAESGVGRKEATQARNLWALGMISWLYDRPIDATIDFIEQRWANAPALRTANIAALRAGHAFGETSELFVNRYKVVSAPTPPGVYRQITGNRALAYGLLAASARAGLPLFLGAYPITPASDVLHILSSAKTHGVLTFQAEDEIAAVGAALGASFAGSMGVTVTSGPGLDLKTETIGLACMVELPLVIIDVQRAGPSTGMPTKTEQGDLLQAVFGRHGDSPVPVLAAATPSDCFDIAYEASRIAITYRTPVIVLSDAYLANGSEPWSVPQLDRLPRIEPNQATSPNGPDGQFWPYLRDEHQARPWAVPGTPGLEHRVGGLEKTAKGDVTYAPQAHAAMVSARRDKLNRIAQDLPDVVVEDPSGRAEVLVLGWGSSWGPVQSAAEEVRDSGRAIATAGLRHLAPLPPNLGEVLRRYRRVVVPEANEGQLALLLRATYLVDVRQYNVVRGLPLAQHELVAELRAIVDEEVDR
jgi:2-oxoglutarate ferredoxin oxidoreductase subunit alpha